MPLHLFHHSSFNSQNLESFSEHTKEFSEQEPAINFVLNILGQLVEQSNLTLVINSLVVVILPLVFEEAFNTLSKFLFKRYVPIKVLHHPKELSQLIAFVQFCV